MFDVWELAGGLTLNYQLGILILVLANVQITVYNVLVTFSTAQASFKICSATQTASLGRHSSASQRSLHNAPIFRLLLKVAVNGTHQCDFHNFCGASGLQQHMIDGLAFGI